MVADLVYDVATFDEKSVEQVHCVRLKLYCASEENSEQPAKLLELAKHTESKYEIVENMRNIGEREDAVKVSKLLGHVKTVARNR